MDRIEREKRVLEVMVEMYCRDHHGSARGELCKECRGLRDYALERLSRCPRGAEKSSCRKCPVHCYSPARREEIRRVMRYVGPRMIWRHPWMAIQHLISELR